MDIIVLGIDLGTTESSIGILINTKIEIIPDKESRNKLIPSIVSFTENEILIGEPAKNNLVKNYKNTIYNIMFLIGKKFDDPEIQKEIKLLSYNVIKGENNKPQIEVEYKKKKQRFFPEEILSFILFKLKRNAEEYLGKKFKYSEVIISCPSYLNYFQKDAIKIACGIAGLNLIRIIGGINTFLIGYNLSKTIQGEKNILIFHLGGGFFDFGIILFDNNLCEVRGIYGDNNLGGEHFDNRLLEYCINKLKKENGIDISNDKQALIRLKIACEKAKINLSKMEFTTITVDNLFNEEDFNITITRLDFEDLFKEDFDKIKPMIEQSLNNIFFTKDKIDDIFLIGGSTHIPKIKKIVKDYFEKEPIKTYSLETETIGAVIQSGISNNIYDTSCVLLDLKPLSLGIESGNGEMSVIFPNDKTIPGQVTRTYEFNANHQNNISIKIYEGEKRIAKENILIGIIEIKNIVPNQQGIFRINVNFLLDINGDLTIKVFEQNGQKINNLKIKMDYVIDENIIIKLMDKAQEIQEDIKRYSEKMKIKNDLLSKVMFLKNNENKDIKKKAEETLFWIKSNLDASENEYEEKLNLLK